MSQASAKQKMPDNQTTYLQREQVNALLMQAPVSNLTIFAISTLFYFILKDHLEAVYLIAWVALMYTVAIFRLLIWQVHRSRPDSWEPKTWLLFYTLGCLFVGVAWSSIYLAMDTTNFVIVVSLLMLIFGVLSSSVMVLSPYLPAFIAYTAPQVLVLAFTINRGEQSFYLLTVALLTYLIMLTLFARNAGRLFEAQIVLASENRELVGQLNQEIEQRENIINQRTEQLSESNKALKREIVTREQAEYEQQLQFNLLRSVMDSTPDIIFYKDYLHANGVYLGGNEAFCRFVDKPLEEIVGLDDIELFGETVGSLFRDRDNEMLSANETRITEEWVKYPDGKEVLLSTLKAPFYDASGDLIGVIGISRDLTERKAIEEKLRNQERSLRHLAHHDVLTQLPNRLLLIDRLSTAIERAARAGHRIAVLFIDLDHFKEVNDSLGHTIGDQLLKAAAERLQHSVRKEDTVSRLGGDEFTVMVELTEDDNTPAHLAEKIIQQFNEPIHLPGRELNITASIGISLYPQDGDNFEDLLRNADAAMYRTKTEGRNGYRFYSAEMTERAQLRLELEADLRRAIDQQQFVLEYQPQIALDSGQITGVEALLRWQHPTKGLLLPGEFIEVAEETGLINRIGEWVVRSVCETLKQWQASDRSAISFSINLSGRQFLNPRLAESLLEIIDETGCDARYLEFEITEGFLIQHPEKSKAMLDQLRQKGASIAIDDFGTGYSSLSYLKQFPISKLKIDYSFVRDIATDVNDRAIAAAVIALGKSLNLTVVAEGVENQQQAEFLLSHGCDQAQAFLYARSLSLTDLDHFIDDQLAKVV